MSQLNNDRPNRVRLERWENRDRIREQYGWYSEPLGGLRRVSGRAPGSGTGAPSPPSLPPPTATSPPSSHGSPLSDDMQHGHNTRAPIPPVNAVGHAGEDVARATSRLRTSRRFLRSAGALGLRAIPFLDIGLSAFVAVGELRQRNHGSAVLEDVRFVSFVGDALDLYRFLTAVPGAPRDPDVPPSWVREK